MRDKNWWIFLFNYFQNLQFTSNSLAIDIMEDAIILLIGIVNHILTTSRKSTKEERKKKKETKKETKNEKWKKEIKYELVTKPQN